MNMASVSFDNYAEFYSATYPDSLLESSLVDGDNPIGMALFEQGQGSYPDEAMPFCNILLNTGATAFTEMDLGLGRKKISPRRGEIVVAPPNTATEFDCFNRHRIMGIGIPEVVMQDAAEDIGVRPQVIESLLSDAHADPITRVLMKECWSESRSGCKKGALFVDAQVNMLARRILLLGLGRQQPTAASSEAALDDASFNTISEYVDAHLPSNIRMAELAKLTGRSEHSFARAFKARTQLSPYQWVLERRVQRAEGLVRHSSMQLSEIAYSVGFSSQAHMTSVFSKRLGVTPAELRRQN